MSPQTKAMQDDPTLNPATFWIMDGESLWTQKPSSQSPACSECHSQVNTSMKGVSATFPKSVRGQLLNLDGQINHCRTTKQQQTVWPLESKALLSMSVLIANQSKCMPIVANQQPETQSALKAGARQELSFGTLMKPKRNRCASGRIVRDVVKPSE